MAHDSLLIARPRHDSNYQRNSRDVLIGLAAYLAVPSTWSLLAGFRPRRSRTGIVPTAVTAAALVGIAGNELVARYRTTVGRRMGSATLVADGLHARTDGFASVAVLLGALGVTLGWTRPTLSSAWSSPSPSSACCARPPARSAPG